MADVHGCSSCGQEFERSYSHCRDHDGFPRCDSCGLPAETLNEADQCEDCHDLWMQREMAYWRPLYEGEKACRGYEDARADLIAAGRGHLVRP